MEEALIFLYFPELQTSMYLPKGRKFSDIINKYLDLKIPYISSMWLVILANIKRG